MARMLRASYYEMSLTELHTIGGIQMNIKEKMVEKVHQATAKTAMRVATNQASRVCVGILYQPTLPDKVKKLRKF